MASTLLRNNVSIRRGLKIVFTVCFLLPWTSNSGFAFAVTCTNCEPALQVIMEFLPKIYEEQQATNEHLENLTELQKKTLA